MKLNDKKISKKEVSVVFFEVHAGIEGTDFVCVAVEYQGGMSSFLAYSSLCFLSPVRLSG